MKYLALFVLLLAIPIVSAQNFTTAEAGNVTSVNITSDRQTTNWQGIAGQVFFGTNATAPSVVNATGGLVNATNFFFEIDCDDPISATGFIFLSNSSTQPSSLTAGNLTQLDSFVGPGIPDTGSATFNSTSTFALTQGTITDVPTVFIFVNETAQVSSFREGYFNQGNDLVFVIVIEEDLRGYNTSFFDYQAILPAPNQATINYFLFSDITFTCPAVPEVVVGGGGGRPQYIPAIIIRKPEKPEVPVRVEQPAIIAELLKYLNLTLVSRRLQPRVPEVIEGYITNRNGVGIGNVRLEVLTPEIVIPSSNAHPHPLLFWSERLGGWGDHGRPRPTVRSWQVTDLPYFDILPPRSVTKFTFTAMHPLLLPGIVDIGAFAYSGETRIASTSEPFEIIVPEFAVYPEWINSRVLTLYYVVDNRGRPGKDINIELALNKGRSTLIAEIIGPLRVPADRVTVYAYEYRLNKKALAADTIDARLVSKEGVQHTSYRLR